MQRKRLYQDCASKLSYTFRRPLPDCLVGMVRGIWPSATGLYMGYKPGSGWGGAGWASSSDDDGDSDSDGGGAGGGGLTGAVGAAQGLAEHKDTLGAPLCPCRHYEDKEAEVKNGFWNCPCVPMRERKECHCMLFLTEDSPFQDGEATIGIEDISREISGGGA